MGDQTLFSVFVDNLPKEMDVTWLRKLFSGFGLVRDAYMPLKRSATFNTKFGFIKYRCKEEAVKAIHELNGVVIRDFQIVVQFAKYSFKRRSSQEFKRISPVDLNLHAEKRWGQNDVNFQSNTDHPSLAAAPKGGTTFAEVLKGVSNGVTKCVEAKESGVDWLHKSVVGKLTNFCLVNTLQDLFISNGIWDAHIRPLGGLNVLISFDTVDSLEDFMLDKNRCLPHWFSSVEIWQNQRIKPSRSTWLSCYGVPVNAWNSQTFSSIGSLWGKVEKLDELTDKLIAFDKGRIFIVTDFLDCINEVIHIKVNGDVFPIKVVEDPLAETTWEKRVYTSIKVKNGYGKDNGNATVEVESDDESMELNAAINLAQSQVPDAPFGSNVEKSAPIMDKGVHLCLKEVDSTVFISPLKPDSVGSKAADSLSTCDSLVGESREAIDSFEDIAAERQLDLFRNNNCLAAVEVVMDSVEGIEQEGSQLPISLGSVEVVINNVVEPTNDIPLDQPDATQLSPVKAALKGTKGKKKRKTLEEIMGLPKAYPGNYKGGRKTKKCVVLRSAVAAAALSASISSDGIANRNHVLLNESQAIRTINKASVSSFNKIAGAHYMGDDEEVLSKAKDLWESQMSFGLGYDGNEEDVIRRIALMEVER